MLTLKRNSIEITDKESDKFFVRLSLDTEPFGYGAGLDRFFRGELIIEKPWTGSVSRDKTKFKVRRTRTGIFNTGVSMLEICGELTLTKHGRTIETKIRPVWYVTLSFIWVTAFLSIVTWNLFNDVTGWAVCISIVILQILFLVLDLNKTDERLINYIDQCKK